MTASDLRLGDTLGPYRLEAVLGTGAMGVVFRAVALPGGETVALKVLRPELGGSDVYRRRLAREARVASEVRDKHLVSVLEAGEADGHHYVAVEYVAGGSVAEWLLREGRLSLDETVHVAVGVGSGLEALHTRGIVHRDVKPSNVMLDDDRRVLLTDFGLAKGRAYTLLTKSGLTVGTINYLAPEVILGEAARPTSDVYSLGCLVFECLTGEPPFPSTSLVRAALAHLDEPPPDPRTRRPELPSGVSWAVLQALDKEPAARPPSTLAYARMLRVAARSRPAD